MKATPLETGNSKATRGRRRRTSVSTPLPSSFQLSENDVVCLRGKLAFEHEGNRRFRTLIQQNLQRYAGATKFQKSQIVLDIFNAIQNASPQGGFVKYNEVDGWVRVSDTTAKEKVGQTFRDLLQTRGGPKARPTSKSLSPTKGKHQSTSNQQTPQGIPGLSAYSSYSSDPGFLAQMDHSTRFPASSDHHPSLINSASSIGSSANNLSLGSINLSTTATPLASPPALLPMPTIGERSYSDSYATSGRNSAFSSTSHTSANSTTTISNSSSNFQRQMLQMPNTSWTSTLTAGNQQYPQESTRSINTLLEQSRSGFSGEESLEPLPLNFPNQMLLETQHPTDQRQPNTAEDAASREETTFEDAMEALYHRMNRGNL